MATSVQEAQWSRCLASCELCNLNPEAFNAYLTDFNSRTLECGKTFEYPLSVVEESKDLVTTLKECVEDRFPTDISDLAECCRSDSCVNEWTVKTASVTQSEAISIDENQDDVWSVVSDVCDSSPLQSVSQEEVDEERKADEDTTSDGDRNKTHGEDEEQRLDDNTDTGKGLDNDTDEQDQQINLDDNEDEHFDDCTEEGIRLAEVQKQLEDCKQETLEYCHRLEMMYRKQLEETERQHQAESATERERTASASATAAVTRHQCDRMSSRICELEEKIKICAQEARKLECELESKRCKEVDTLKLEHYNRYERLKLKFKQEYHVVRKALEESEENRHQDAVRHANLFVEAADTLSEQIKKAEDMKVACEKTLETTNKVHDIEAAKLHVNLRWLEDKLKRALAKEAEDHGAHLHTRNQLAKAEVEVEELEQKEQEMASAKEELQRQHEQQLAEVRDSYEQKLELAKQEHEADNALNEEQVCDLEAEMDAMCQEKDELYHERDQMCEKMADAYQDLEISHAHEMREANEEIERLEQSLRTMSEELEEVKEEKLQLGRDMDEAEATMEELCQEAQDSEAGHKQDMSEAASRRRELEREVKDLRRALDGAKQEDNDFREQLQKANKGMEELVKREQALVSQCAADRLMFERSAFALRSLLQKN
ncbi:hypothetical protein M436DRAFT_67186 [Aureobasidium namibiae CBS 147.97]|uniref:Uncharacterized protein n=1 Tax=Aureobasidium namibiae CBS 147.97 TaxID=1043004 RepID=A0A074W9E0_9PEZI